MRNQLVVLSFCFLFGSIGFAEEQTTKGTIKAVDADKKQITLNDLELEVSRKTTITIDGKKAALADIKTGQEANVTYDDKVDVVLSIAIGKGSGADDKSSASIKYKKTGCRVLWKIAENGESTLTISRPIENREFAKEGMIRHDDGTIEFQHDFLSKETADKALMGGSAENVEFDKPKHALVMTPKVGKGYEGLRAMFSYSKLARFPVTLEFDIEHAGASGSFVLFATVKKRGNENVEFPYLNLSSKDRFKSNAVLSLDWMGSRNENGKPQIDTLLEEQIFELKEPKEFKFTIPLTNTDLPYILGFGVRGDAQAALPHLAVRGRLRPTFGVAFDEKNSVKNISPNALGDTIGLKAGDVVVSINGNKSASMKETTEFLSKIQFGEESEIVVKRNGKTIKIGFTAE